MPLLDRDKYFHAPQIPPSLFSCPDCGGKSWAISTNREIFCTHCDAVADLDQIFMALKH